MKLLIFCIFDQKAQAHLPPFTLPTIAMAQRTFADCVNSKSHAFGRNPADYTLIQSGQWDDNTNKYDLLDLPNVLGTGIQFVVNPLPGLNPHEESQKPEIPLGNGSSVLPRTES